LAEVLDPEVIIAADSIRGTQTGPFNGRCSST
jgi:hypothetical protein